MSDMLEFQRVMSKSFSLAGNITDSWRLVWEDGGESSSDWRGKNEQQWYAYDNTKD